MQEEAVNSLPMNTCCERCLREAKGFALEGTLCVGPDCKCHQEKPTSCYCKIIGTACWGNDCTQCRYCSENPVKEKPTHEIEGWDWKKEYDKLVGLEMVGSHETYTKHADPMAIKGFIMLILTHQQERIIAALEGMKLTRESTPFHVNDYLDYNAALTEAIEVVKEI